MRNTLAALVLSMLPMESVLADVTGMAGVAAGDVLTIDGALYRLYGIDAVEQLQPCYVDGKKWACGPVAIRQLQIFVANEPVTCKETGESAGALGMWAVCTIRDNDLGKAMVRTGMALAYRSQTDQYVAAEEAAKAEGAGIWKSIFIEPWVYREDTALIEKKIAERLRSTPLDAKKIDSIRLQIERALTRGNGGIEVFQRFQIVRNDRNTTQRETFISDVHKGYLTEPLMARLPGSWQNRVAHFAHQQVIQFVWDDLAAHPRRELSAPDSEAYLRILKEQAAPIIRSGRKPVLLVRGLEDPPWIRDWLEAAEGHPDGVQVSKRKDVDTDLYLGTVNGIDVYAVLPPDEYEGLTGVSFVIPNDFLGEVRYGADPDGHIVAVAFRDATGEEPGRLVFHFSLGTEWLGDEVVVLTYPPVKAADDS